MKRLLKVPLWVWVVLSLVIIMSIATLIIILNLKIETSHKIKITYNQLGAEFDMKPADVYDVHLGSKVTIRVKEEFYSGIIHTINYDEVSHLYKIGIQGLNYPFIPNTTLDATFIIDTQKVFKHLLLYN